MIKVALVIAIISISNTEKAPDISIPVYYDSIEECDKQLDSLKAVVNASEMVDKKNNRILMMENREYHHRSYIYWSCTVTKENNSNIKRK